MSKVANAAKENFLLSGSYWGGRDLCGFELFWVCDAVYFETKLFAGIDQRMHVSECIEHPDLASAAFWEVDCHDVQEIRTEAFGLGFSGFSKF
jgi:hypothetical protein